jgi:environmental stress-induced protein Ves
MSLYIQHRPEIDFCDQLTLVRSKSRNLSSKPGRIGSLNILRYSDLIDVPWKNGGGITRNIALATCDAQTVWRLSRADVAEDGAFSHFEGLVRILTVVSRSGMVLEQPGGELNADPWHPVRFGGELKVFARLKDGPLTDLNLMFDPDLCDGSVNTLRGPFEQVMAPPESGITALHVLAGLVKLGGQRLGVGDTVFLDATTNLGLGENDAVLEITVRIIDHSKVITFSIAAR